MTENGITISALNYEGLSAIAPDGKAAQFAIVDEDGKVIASGQQVTDAALAVSIVVPAPGRQSEG